MKKILSWLSAALIIAGTFAFTGCEEVAKELADELAPNNTWCELPVDMGSDGEPDLYLEVIFCPSAYKGTAGSTNLNTKITLEPGITVVAHAAAKLDSLGMNVGSYTMKTFPLNAVENNSDDNDSFTFTGSKEKWALIYFAKDDLRNKNTQIVLPKAPTAVCNTNTGYAELTDLSKFNWKALLASYLLK